MGRAYAFNSNNHFLRYSDKLHSIQVDELQTPDSLPLSFHDWKLVVSVGRDEEYDSLKVFDTVIDGIRLKNLEEDLCNSHLMINPEGFCYLDTTEIVGPTFNVQYYKLNDLFCWSEYVDLPPTVTLKTSWKRCGIQTGDTLVDYDQSNEDLEEKNMLLKQTEGELESTQKQFALAKNKLRLLEQELKNNRDELYDTSNKIFHYEKRLEAKDSKLQRLREKLSSNQIKLEESERESKTQREELLAATNKLKYAEQELKQKHDELLEANNKISQHETHLEEKDRKIERLRDMLFSSETKMEKLHNNIKKQNEVKKETRNEAQPSSSMSKNDIAMDMQKRMSIEWQNLTEVWNHNKKKVPCSIYKNELGFTSVMVRSDPLLDGPLREFKELAPFNNYRHHNNGFVYSVGGRLGFDPDNWWCIGSYEHGKKINLFVY